MRSLSDDNDNYHDCFELIYQISKDLAKQYLLIIYMDTLCFDIDRHTDNFGFFKRSEKRRLISTITLPWSPEAIQMM